MNAEFAAFMLRARALGGNVTPILRAMEGADRRKYLSRDLGGSRYSNDLLPAPCGQTTDRLDDLVRLVSAADLAPEHRVLEIGTGTGFLTAILAELADHVVTLERYRTLLDRARTVHAENGIRNVTYRQADGGNPEAIEGTFDRIVSSVAFRTEPKAFISRLSVEGVLVLPIGDPTGPQTIYRLQKVGLRFERTVIGEGWFPPIERGIALAL